MKNNYLLKQKNLVREFENSLAHGVNKSTVVDIRRDYANDDQICLTSLAFVSYDIFEKIIERIVGPLRKIESFHYFIPFGSMHLTIKNIRTISKPPLFTESDIKKVNQLFKKIIPKFSIFEFYVEDVLLFPTSLSVIAYCGSTVQKLVLSLDKGLNEIGVPDNKKYFSDFLFWGNITVCRFTKHPGLKFMKAAKKMRNLKIGKLKIEKINLITCNAVCYPKSRKIIAEYKLGLP